MTEGRQLDAVEDDVEEVFPEDAATRPEDTPVDPEPAVEAHEPVAEADEPVAEADEPVAESDEPVAEAHTPAESDELAAESDEPVAESDEPVAEAHTPAAESDEPTAETDEPVAEADEPAAEAHTPAAESDEPTAETDEPAAGSDDAAAEAEAPGTGADEPPTDVDAPTADADAPQGEPVEAELDAGIEAPKPSDVVTEAAPQDTDAGRDADEPIDQEPPAEEPPVEDAPVDVVPAEVATAEEPSADDGAVEGPDEALPAEESPSDAPRAADAPAAAPAGEPMPREDGSDEEGPADRAERGEPAAPTDEPAPAAPVASEPAGEAWTPRPWEAPTVVMNPVGGDHDASAPTAPGVTRTSAMPPRTTQPQPTAAEAGAPAAASTAPLAASTAPLAATTAASTATGVPARTQRPGAAAPADAAKDGEPGRTSPMDVFPDEPHRRRWPRVLGLTAAVLVVLAGAYVGALWLWSDRVPTGTTVAGVEIGGLPAAEAEAQLDESLAAATTEPIPVTAGDVQATLDPTTAGLTFDAEATVASVTGFDLQPVRLWHHLFGAGEVEPVTVVDEETLDVAVRDLAETLATPPVDGTIVFVDGQAQTTDAVDGAAVDEETAAAALVDGWLTAARPLELTTEVVPPAITQEEVDRALAEVARPFVGAPVVVSVADQLAELPVDVLAASASFVPQDDELVLQLDGAMLVEAVTARTTNLLTAPSDASFAFENGSPVIVPGIPGTTLDPDAVADAVAQAGTGPDRTARVELVETDPAESTAELEALGITQVVAEFSTPLNSEPRRTTNIINGASKINGKLIRPGEVFSLTEALGPIDAAHGFVQAGAIVSGEHTDAWGGGLSQLSTTTYNAAFFAGYEDVEHHPHSEWFSRYPEGREATIFTGVLDMQWGNNTPYGALVQAWVDGGRVYVRIWSTPHWTVETSTSGRSNVVSPTTVYSQSPTCEAQSKGNPGFSVTVTRRTLLQGVEQDKQSWTVRYKPQNQVICGPPPAATPPPTG